MDTLGPFVLITNLMIPQNFWLGASWKSTGNTRLWEQRFAFLNGSSSSTASFSIRAQPHRGLAYVLVMACVLYSIVECCLRLRLQATGDQIQLPGDRWPSDPPDRRGLPWSPGFPSAASALDPRDSFHHPISPSEAARVAYLAGFDLIATYATPPTCPPLEK